MSKVSMFDYYCFTRLYPYIEEIKVYINMFRSIFNKIIEFIYTSGPFFVLNLIIVVFWMHLICLLLRDSTLLFSKLFNEKFNFLNNTVLISKMFIVLIKKFSTKNINIFFKNFLTLIYLMGNSLKVKQ